MYMKKLVLVTGAAGSLGEAYLNYFQTFPEYRVVALVRTEGSLKIPEVVSITADLLNSSEVMKAIEALSLEDISDITLIHPVGKFKFEESGVPENDANNDGIDDEVYASNVITLENILETLLIRMEKEGRVIPLTVCAFGSISSKYDIPYWRSYTRAKNIVRSTLRTLSGNKERKIRGVFVEVSTTDTGNENLLRPHADKTYWLSPKEIVERSVSAIMGSEPFVELGIYKPWPEFTSNYYENIEQIREKWGREMGKKFL